MILCAVRLALCCGSKKSELRFVAVACGLFRLDEIPSLTWFHAAKSFAAFRDRVFGFELIESNVVVRRSEAAPTVDDTGKRPLIPETFLADNFRERFGFVRARDDHRDVAADRSDEPLVKIARAEAHVEVKVVVIVGETNQLHAEPRRIFPEARLDTDGVILRAKRKVSLGERAFQDQVHRISRRNGPRHAPASFLGERTAEPILNLERRIRKTKLLRPRIHRAPL